MTTPTASESLRFHVRSHLATARGLAILLLGFALTAGFVASATQAPDASPAASASRVS
jgi:hypothetical protein